VPEGVDERGGDVVRDVGQALFTGLVGRMDEPAQGVADLARPDRLRVGLGVVLAVADQVLASRAGG
jgi:hypothetical protein